MKSWSKGGNTVRSISTTVAAAASVPSSSTETNALWSTTDMDRSPCAMPLKSAPLLNARLIHIGRSCCDSSELTVISNCWIATDSHVTAVC